MISDRAEEDETSMTPHTALLARPYQGAPDAGLIAELINDSRASTAEESAFVSAEHVRSFIEDSWAGFDPETDLHLFFRGGLLVAYERTKRETWAGGARVYHLLPYVRDGWCDREILVGILDHAVRYHAAYAIQHEHETTPFLAAVPEPPDASLIDALLAAGFEPCRRFLQMARTLEEGVEPRELPAGIDVRPLKDSQHRSVYEFDRQIMRGSWGVEVPSEEHFRWWAEEAFMNPELWRVAWHGDAIVGTAAGIVGGT